MTTRRAAQPLNPEARDAANEAVWQEMDRRGESRRQLTMESEDYEYRRMWMDAYIAAGGAVENPTPGRHASTPTRLCQPGGGATLVSLTVIRNATQNNVTGAKNWATVKNATGDVIVEATTNPNTPETWQHVQWSGDAGVAVPGHANQRQLSRSVSAHHHVVAELCGASDHVDIWVLWAGVANHTSGTTPANAVQFGSRYDGTENLGARSYNGGNSAVGKVVPVATITPAGVHAVVQSGWSFERQKWRHDFKDGARDTSRWDSSWQPDTSYPSFQNLVPDANDKIYDRDAPNIAGFSGVLDSYERYDNFREWVEWNGTRCSDYGGWYWRARWKRDQTPQVTLKELNSGSISPLPSATGNHYSAPP